MLLEILSLPTNGVKMKTGLHKNVELLEIFNSFPFENIYHKRVVVFKIIVMWLIILFCYLTERRKLAKQPEVVSVDELKSLLILIRERFLDRFDALIPKTVPIKTDKIKTSNMLNGKFFVGLNISSFCICDIYDSYLLLKLIK